VKVLAGHELDAPEEFDGDDAAEAIAVRYVRHLEACKAAWASLERTAADTSFPGIREKT
jgi:hypothetical protein